MVFSSITFLFYFLPMLLIAYFVVPKKMKNLVLLIFSFAFYYYGEPKYVYVILSSILITYISGLLIYKYPKFKKMILIFFICISVGILMYFKYTNFFIQNLNLFLKNKIDFINVVLPIGISFYTFQMISYVIDVYRGEVKVQKNILKLAMYVALFPQLIAGPIVRYSTIEDEIENRTITFEKFSIGVRRFIVGLAKKVLIANVLGEVAAIFLASNDTTVLFYWVYAVSITLQIYFDFSGYSDMAIGLGRMFGFEFLENFNYPYTATSITDFWRRWHISLSSWFRDYIYIPLGGNRVSKLKWFRNILIVWFLTGFWHGAAWNFIMWGLFFGILLIIEKLFFGKVLQKLPKFIARIYVLFIVMISFIMFNGENVNMILKNIGGLFGLGGIKFTSAESIYYFKSYLVPLLIGMFASTPIYKKLLYLDFKKVSDTVKNCVIKILNILEPVFLIMILIVCTAYIIDGSFNPFLYFRF